MPGENAGIEPRMLCLSRYTEHEMPNLRKVVSIHRGATTSLSQSRTAARRLRILLVNLAPIESTRTAIDAIGSRECFRDHAGVFPLPLLY